MENDTERTNSAECPELTKSADLIECTNAELTECTESTNKKVSFGIKFKNEIINKIKYEIEKNQHDLINPIINYMIDQFHFEFKTYLIIAELGLLLVILLFIINICFIFWISNKAGKFG